MRTAAGQETQRRAELTVAPVARPTPRVALRFLLVAVVGLVSAFLPPYAPESATGVGPGLAVGVFAVCLGFVVAAVRSPVRTWVDPVGPWLFLLVLALARDATGGSTSGLAPLAALPMIWLAMMGTRRDLMVGAALTAAVFVVPILVVGAPSYAVQDWRRALLWTVVAVVIGPAIQTVVRRLSAETVRERATSAQLDAITRGSRLSSVVTVDLTGVIRSFSVGAEELLGYRADDVVGVREVSSLHDPDEIRTVAVELGVQPGFEVFAELARREAPSRVWTYRRADGSAVHVQLVLTELSDAFGSVVGYLGVAIDTSAAVAAEHALSLSEARWRVLVDHLPDLTVLQLDVDRRIRVVAGAGAMRHAVQDAVGQRFAAISDQANLEVLEPLFERAFRGEEGSVELSATADGSQQAVDVTPLPADDDGARILVLARDVSVERAHEREIVRSKDRADRLFEDAPYGIAILTVEGVVTRVNAAMRALLGPVPDGVEGRHFSEVSGADLRDLEVHLSQTILAGAAGAEADWTIRTADGRVVTTVLSTRLLLGHDGWGEPDEILLHVVDVSERHRYEQQLTHLADHDALTGLVNRRGFDAELQRHLARCRRHGLSGALLLLDLDHFKDVNDSLGHAAGDELLVSVATLLRTGLRAGDVVARLGGDEFAVLLPDSDRAAAEAVGCSIVTRVRAHTAGMSGARRRVTTSVGAVTLRTAAQRGADLMALADKTMYDAKEQGRDRCVVLAEEPAGQLGAEASRGWGRRLDAALADDTLELLLQPVLDLRSGGVHAAEAVLRLRDADGLVEAGDVLQVAERCGLASALDAWVLPRAAMLLERLQERDPAFELVVHLAGPATGVPQLAGLVHVPPDVLDLPPTDAPGRERGHRTGVAVPFDDFVAAHLRDPAPSG